VALVAMVALAVRVAALVQVVAPLIRCNECSVRCPCAETIRRTRCGECTHSARARLAT
jgi:hypothetical protein